MSLEFEGMPSWQAKILQVQVVDFKECLHFIKASIKKHVCILLHVMLPKKGYDEEASMTLTGSRPLLLLLLLLLLLQGFAQAVHMIWWHAEFPHVCIINVIQHLQLVKANGQQPSRIHLQATLLQEHDDVVFGCGSRGRLMSLAWHHLSGRRRPPNGPRCTC